MSSLILFNAALADLLNGNPTRRTGSISVLGTNRSDLIEASNTNDAVFGFDGNDLIYGLGSSDNLHGEDTAQRDINELIPNPDDCDPSRPISLINSPDRIRRVIDREATHRIGCQ